MQTEERWVDKVQHLIQWARCNKICLILHSKLKTAVNQGLPRWPDSIGRLRAEGGWLNDAANAIWKWGLGVLWPPPNKRNWVLRFSLFLVTGHTRRPAIVWMESDWTIQRHDKSWFLLKQRVFLAHCVRYPFPQISMASKMEGIKQQKRVLFLYFRIPIRRSAIVTTIP